MFGTILILLVTMMHVHVFWRSRRDPVHHPARQAGRRALPAAGKTAQPGKADYPPDRENTPGMRLFTGSGSRMIEKKCAPVFIKKSSWSRTLKNG